MQNSSKKCDCMRHIESVAVRMHEILDIAYIL